MGIWRVRGWPSLLVAPVLMVVLLAGCGSSGGNGSPEDEGDGSTTATRSSGTTGPDEPSSTGGNGSGDGNGSDDGNGSGDGNGSDEGIAWVPFGPDDPEFPDPGVWPLYRNLANGKCATVQAYAEDIASSTDRPNYGKALTAVCRAAVDGSEGQWAVAQDFLDAGLVPLGVSCLDSVVTDLVKRALAWHKEHPGEKPTVHFQRVDGKTECGKDDGAESEEPTTEEPTTDEPTTEEPSPTADDSSTPVDSPTPDETPEPTG